MKLHDRAMVEAVPHLEIGGQVAPGFELVRNAFVDNFVERCELGGDRQSGHRGLRRRQARDRARARGSLRWGGGDRQAIATAYGAFAAAGGPLGLRNALNTVLSRKDGVRLPEQCTR